MVTIGIIVAILLDRSDSERYGSSQTTQMRPRQESGSSKVTLLVRGKAEIWTRVCPTCKYTLGRTGERMGESPLGPIASLP